MGKAIKKLRKLEQELEQVFERWSYLRVNGGSDPFYEDGVNMNLVRNHILYYREQIRELCDKEGLQLPKVYYQEIPPSVDHKYMANREAIRAGAIKSLEMYEGDSNFQELEKIYGSIPDRDSKETARNILGYKQGLEIAIKQDDFVVMRRHLNYHSYQASAENFIKNITEEIFMEATSQLTIFDVDVTEKEEAVESCRSAIA